MAKAPCGQISKYTIIETSASGQSYSSAISKLATKYAALSDEQKLKCAILHGSEILTINHTNGTFQRISISANDVYISAINLVSGAYYLCHNSFTVKTYTSQTMTIDMKLILLE